MANFLITETDDCFGLPVKASTAGQSFKAWEKSARALNQIDFRHLGPNSDLVLKLLRLKLIRLPLNWEPQAHQTTPELGASDKTRTVKTLWEGALRTFELLSQICTLSHFFPIKAPFPLCLSPFQTHRQLTCFGT